MSKKLHDIVCIAASGAAAAIWPPIAVGISLALIGGAFWLVGHLHMPAVETACEWAFKGFIILLVCAWWLTRSVKAYDRIRRVCSGKP